MKNAFQPFTPVNHNSSRTNLSGLILALCGCFAMPRLIMKLFLTNETGSRVGAWVYALEWGHHT